MTAAPCLHDEAQREYFNSHLAIQYKARAFRCKACDGRFIVAPLNRIFPYKIFSAAAETLPPGEDGQK